MLSRSLINLTGKIFAALIFLFASLPASIYGQITDLHPEWDSFYGKNTDTLPLRPHIGDYVTIHLSYRTENDSVLYDSHSAGGPVRFPLASPPFSGAIEEGIMGMSPGDTLKWNVSADSVFEVTFQSPLPAYILRGSMLRFEIELLNIESAGMVEAILDSARKEKENEERTMINNFLASVHTLAKPSESGLLFISLRDGHGRSATDGKRINVRYTCRLINDTAVLKDSADPVSFSRGMGEMVTGFEEGVDMMREGGRAILVIPSRIGFISMPYTPLVFEVELLGVE